MSEELRLILSQLTLGEFDELVAKHNLNAHQALKLTETQQGGAFHELWELVKGAKK